MIVIHLSSLVLPLDKFPSNPKSRQLQPPEDNEWEDSVIENGSSRVDEQHDTNLSNGWQSMITNRDRCEEVFFGPILCYKYPS